MNIAAMYKYLFLLFLFINYGYACISSGVSMAQEKLISHFICGKVYVSGGFDKVFGGIIVVGIDKIVAVEVVSRICGSSLVIDLFNFCVSTFQELVLTV